MVDELLIPVRAVHFAATALVAGGVLFLTVIAEPALRAAGAQALPAAERFRKSVNLMVWIALVVAVVSGVAWLVLLAASIAEGSFAAAFDAGVPQILLLETEFGHAWLVRLVLACALAAAVLLPRFKDAARVLCAMLLLGSLAWSGHAAGTPGSLGDVHRAADFLHLLAAGTWLGALVPLALLLHLARRSADVPLAGAARAATFGFSTLGQLSVGTLIVTGAFNTWILVGSLQGLVTTDYGLLLLCKLGLFAAMLCIASVNRFHLSRRLPDPDAMRELARNALIETALGLAILAIVGVLGILPPAAHAGHAHMH